MAVKRFCDRCGDEIASSYKYFEITVIESSELQYATAATIPTKDICRRCTSAYEAWFKQGQNQSAAGIPLDSK